MASPFKRWSFVSQMAVWDTFGVCCSGCFFFAEGQSRNCAILWQYLCHVAWACHCLVVYGSLSHLELVVCVCGFYFIFKK